MRKYVALALVLSAPAPAWGASVVKSPTLVSPTTAPTPAPLPTDVMQVWKSAPLTEGGYARCIDPGGCHASYSQDIIANYDTVWMYSWVGVSSGAGGMEQRQIGAFWPQGNFKEAGLGKEGFVDEWEGVN